MNDKSILFINSGSLPMPPVAGGAVQQVLYSVAVELAKRNWKVGVLTPATPASEAAQDSGGAGISWYRMEGPIKSGGIRGILTSRRTIKRSLAKINSREYAHVVIFDPYVAPEVKKWNPSASITWSVHNVRNRTAPLVKLWSRHFQSVVSVSQFLKEQISVTLSSKPKENHIVIHNPLPEKWFSDETGVSRKPKSILFCGRIVPYKGLDILVKALLKLPKELRSQVELGIAGATHFAGSSQQNEYSSYVQGLLENSDIRYKFLGYINHAELHKVYDQYEILAIPSNWAEPATLVAGEGQSRDCIVISSTAGGLPEMVSPVFREYMVPPGDDEALAASLKKALTEGKPDAHEEVKAWLRREFDISGIVSRWETILRAV